jgi:hypothetical protein
MFKRICSFFLAVCLVFGAGMGVETAFAAKPSLKTYIADNLLNYSTTIDLSDYVAEYKLTFEKVCDVWYDIIKNDVRFFHVQGSFVYNYSVTGSNYAAMTGIKYSTAKTSYAKTLTQIEAVIDDALDIARPWMTDVQKALALHDFLVLRTAYDEDIKRFGIRDVLIGRNAVCEGYATVYKYLMERSGVECQIVRSNALNHVWNIVKIGGDWYHVDATWDDPSPDVLGRVSHENFLLTDAEITATGHKGWETDIKCNGASFAGGFWKEAVSGIFYAADYDYYTRLNFDANRRVTGAEIIRRNRYTARITVLKTFAAAQLKEIGAVSLALYNGKLYYAANSVIGCMSFDGRNQKTLKSYTDISGMTMEGHTLRFRRGTNVTYVFRVEATSTPKITLSAAAVSVTAGRARSLRAARSSGTDYLYWESSNPAIATVSNNGVIKGVGTGMCTIRVWSDSGAYTQCKVTVTK